MKFTEYPLSIKDRFWAKVNKTESCWEWQASSDPFGYGRLNVYRAPHLAHRISFFFANGPFPADSCVLHKCDNPKCVNPGHLFLGTRQENMADKMRKGRFVDHQAKKTHCPKGHPYSGSNLAVLSRRRDGSIRPERRCKTCSYASKKRHRKMFGREKEIRRRSKIIKERRLQNANI